MDIDKAFPSNYLKAADIDGEITVTIIGCQMEPVRDRNTGKDEDKAVLHFIGDTKPLILNVTNKNTIKKLLGTGDTEGWNSRRITLIATTTEFGGEMVDCIRIKPELPQDTPETVATSTEIAEAEKLPI